MTPTKDTLHGLALCAGIGGLELGLASVLPGYRTVCHVEGEAYAAACLVSQMEAGSLDAAPIWSDLTSFDGGPWRGRVDIVTAGYPCQPFSLAGRRGGESDPRHLWPHVRRIIKQCEPRIVFCENVPGHVSLGLEQVASDLQAMGYRVSAGIFSAAEVGAPHLRKRLFILAHADGATAARHVAHADGQRQLQPGRLVGTFGRRVGHGGGETHVAHAAGARRGERQPGPSRAIWDEAWWAQPERRGWWESEPDVGRVVDGIPNRVDRLRALGNAVVPATAALAFRTLAQDCGIIASDCNMEPL